MGAGQIWITKLDQQYEEDLEQKKGLRYDGGEVYRWCQLDPGGVNIVPGRLLDFDLSTFVNDGTTPIAMNSGTGRTPIGVSMPEVNWIAGNYGWVKCGGIIVFNKPLEGSPADGNPLTFGSATTLKLKTLSTEPQYGIALDASENLVLLQIGF